MPAMWAGTRTAVIISEIFHRLVVDLAVFLVSQVQCHMFLETIHSVRTWIPYSASVYRIAFCQHGNSISSTHRPRILPHRPSRLDYPLSTRIHLTSPSHIRPVLWNLRSRGSPSLCILQSILSPTRPYAPTVPSSNGIAPSKATYAKLGSLSRFISNMSANIHRASSDPMSSTSSSSSSDAGSSSISFFGLSPSPSLSKTAQLRRNVFRTTKSMKDPLELVPIALPVAFRLRLVV